MSARNRGILIYIFRLFWHPAILATACFRGPLRSRPFGTGSAALPPADAWLLTATATPGTRRLAPFMPLANGLLMEA